MDFNRAYQEYAEGFGDPSGEFWIGKTLVLYSIGTSCLTNTNSSYTEPVVCVIGTTRVGYFFHNCKNSLSDTRRQSCTRNRYLALSDFAGIVFALIAINVFNFLPQI